jgi:hypothetical protein
MEIITRARWGARHDRGFLPAPLPASEVWLDAGLPPLAGHHHGDQRPADAELCGDSRSCSSSFDTSTDLSDVGGGELPRPRRPVAPLQHRISDVRRLRAEKQVIWPDARAIVAAMHNTKIAGDRPIGQLPGQAVRQHKRAFPPAAAQPAVAGSSCVAAPEPAGRRLLDPGPEAVLERFGLSQSVGSRHELKLQLGGDNFR